VVVMMVMSVRLCLVEKHHEEESSDESKACETCWRCSGRGVDMVMVVVVVVGMIMPITTPYL
jgi:hypothetical protein